MGHKKTFIFDWDDNLLHMSTKIKGQQNIDGTWIDVELSTIEYSLVRNNPEYRFDTKTSFSNFHEDKPFILDVNEALHTESLAPSIAKLKECLINGDDFAIITARGHRPSIIKTGVLQLIFKYLSAYELNMLIEKVSDVISYVEKQKIYPVSSNYFNVLFGIAPDEYTTEERKILALEHYVDGQIKDGGIDVDVSAKISFGFSDDDKLNIEAMNNFMKTTLKPKYDGVKFVLYDTSNPEKTLKITI